MKKKVLEVSQMIHLKELGVNLNNCSLRYVRIVNIKDNQPEEDWRLDMKNSVIVLPPNKRLEQIPAFTLQDIIELLPDEINDGQNTYILSIRPKHKGWSEISYRKKDSPKKNVVMHINLIDAAFKMLVDFVNGKFHKE